MWTYLIKRILWFFPTLLLIALFAFSLSKCTPGDPVEILLELEGVQKEELNESPNYSREYERLSNSLGLDKKVFYFDFVPNNFPDTFQSGSNKSKIKKHKHWLKKGYKWERIELFENNIQQLFKARVILPDTIRGLVSSELSTLTFSASHQELLSAIDRFDLILKQSGFRQNDFNAQISSLKNQILLLEEDKQGFLYPKLRWNGIDNQFHHWLSNTVQGDFGLSYRDGRPSFSRISSAFGWTFFLVIWALILSILISVPLAIYTQIHSNSIFEKSAMSISYLLYSIPLFWLATILVTFFTTPEYGSWTNIFPSVGVLYLNEDIGFIQKISKYGKHLLLPVFCLVLHSLAYLTKQLKSSLERESRLLYVQTGRAKGVSNSSLHWKHIFPNAIFPVITLIVDAFPAALAGSVIIEVIFNIPGMGRLMYDSIFMADWNIVYTILLLLGSITVVSYLIGDILYTVFNPKVRFN